MTNPRIDRIKSFDEFRENAKESFGAYAKSDSSNERLDKLFSLCICPGGRDGGLNKKIVEVFYGNRPIDSVEEVGENWQTITRLETAHGATLSYFRTDDGHVICNLYPAKSENQRPLEEVILLDYLSDPRLLKDRSKLHWKMFVAYMESTCIDGAPNILQRLRVFYLRNFKRYVQDKIVKSRKAVDLIKELSKYVLTVGLSGFIILFVTIIKDGLDSKAQDTEVQELQSVSEQTLGELEVISGRTAALDENLSEVVRLLQALSSKEPDPGEEKIETDDDLDEN